MYKNTEHIDLFNEWLQKLRVKWKQIPGAESSRLFTDNLLKMEAQDLYKFWVQTKDKDTINERFSVRGWYHTLYSDVFRGKKILDVGSGFGIDALSFAQNGAEEVTCLDIVSSNVEVLKKISSVRGLKNVSFCLMDSLLSLESLPEDYDVIWCQGSMINVPFDIACIEAQQLLKHLKPNGRWIELAYPQIRWEREGKMSFEQWGEKTDGGAPWMEWYDLEKILARLSPVEFEPILSFEFHNSDFNWFDLKRKTTQKV